MFTFGFSVLTASGANTRTTRFLAGVEHTTRRLCVRESLRIDGDGSGGPEYAHSIIIYLWCEYAELN